jgi:hypothetical protein
MAALITALDNSTPVQYGENGHAEYGWSNNIQEKIVQFSFQLSRTKDNGEALQVILRDMLVRLKFLLNKDTQSDRELAKGLLSVLYRMIGQTRDVIDGKGEYTLAYMMIYTWHEFYPALAKFALTCFVDVGDKSVHQYGSWKDLKYFCEYVKSKGGDINHPLVKHSVELMNKQLRKDEVFGDEQNICHDISKISLAAKWVPREKSSFGWIYEALACDYFHDIMKTANTAERKVKASLKCKTQYRKLIASLNRKIDTTQIKQCGQNWSAIDFNKVTSITVSKQKRSFLNMKKDGKTVRYPENQDRIECAEHFKARIKQAVAGEVQIKGKRVGMVDFTSQAIDLISKRRSAKSGYNMSCNDMETIQVEIDLLNSQWRDNSTQTGELDKMIATSEEFY